MSDAAVAVALSRKTTRCLHCELNQFELVSRKCRRCGEWLRPEDAPPLPEPEPPPVPLHLPATPAPFSPVLDRRFSRPSSPPLAWLPVVLYILRTQSGLSQRQLATRLHTQRIYISKVENGVRPTLWSFERYAEGLGVSMQKVMEMCEELAHGD
jgi:hypothetical protein